MNGYGTLKRRSGKANGTKPIHRNRQSEEEELVVQAVLDLYMAVDVLADHEGQLVRVHAGCWHTNRT